MRNRCYREKDDYFHCYGGRGIKVCDSWHDFVNFYRDMGEPPKGMCLDRKDNDGDYGPDNCHWTTQKVQQRNRRDNHRLSFNGETLCISEWSERTGISQGTIGSRVRKGWPIAAVLNP
jgi:hypothetical protein